MWKNIVQRGKPQMTIWRITRWMPKALNHIQVVQYLLLFYYSNSCTNATQCYVIRYTYIACLVVPKISSSQTVSLAPNVFIFTEAVACFLNSCSSRTCCLLLTSYSHTALLAPNMYTVTYGK